MRLRNVVLVLGDQLTTDSAAFDAFDPSCDAVWMVEVPEEATHVPSHKARIALFLAAMRHFRDALRQAGRTVYYRQLDDPANRGSFAAELAEFVQTHRPARLLVVEPGEYRVEQALRQTAARCQVPLEVRPDRHFLCSDQQFRQFAKGRKQLLLEHFYRHLRKQHRVLMDGDKPVGGSWNYDAANRKSFGRAGPPAVSPPRRFLPDQTTRQVLELVQQRFPDHPGQLTHFDWPVTAAQAEEALQEFVTHRLAHFGPYQDAMWTDQPYLYHSRLSAAMNLHLLDPRRVIGAAEAAYRAGAVPLASAEGFIRQVLGWREYIRGIYRLHMPDYAHANHLDARQPLPAFYWTADTPMNCLRQAIGQTLDYGYAHHIQRLMVTGLYALLVGVAPRQIHEWYLAVYVDAVEWVEMPNVLGMSQFADGGLMSSKPYIASGKYIQKMSNYCRGCAYDPQQATGPKACPFTTLYWDFLMRHEPMLAANPRTLMQVRNLQRLSPSQRQAIREQAQRLRPLPLVDDASGGGGYGDMGGGVARAD
jgi:deoxyribodipyrimidine photolyase-related protein